jgi:hypothetical protein
LRLYAGIISVDEENATADGLALPPFLFDKESRK